MPLGAIVLYLVSSSTKYSSKPTNDHAVTEQTLHSHSFQGQIPLLAVLEQQAARPWDDVEGACSAVSTALGISQTLWKARRARSRRLEVKISQEVDSWL